jgi:Ca2+-transporting ATPase
MNVPHRAISAFQEALRTVWAVLWRAVRKYGETDAEQRAASFAYYAFFALFPLIILLISIATTFFENKERASTAIMNYVSQYLPSVAVDSLPKGEVVKGAAPDQPVSLDPPKLEQLLPTIEGVVKSRKAAGLIAFGILAWTAMRFFHALVRGVNRAWGTKEYAWWRLPIKNLLMTAILASALLVGILAPLVLRQIETFYWAHSWEIGLDFWFAGNVFNLIRFLVPPLVLFYGFLMLYKFAPRRRTTFREVWFAALFVTLGVDVLQRLFTIYTRNITNFNALYGTFGSVVALLLWIYLIGSIIIFGACLSAAEYEVKMSLADQSESVWAR